MAAGTISPSPVFTGFDNNGVIVPGGKLFTYAAGTTTKQATYTDVLLTTPNANPIILSAAGRCVMFWPAGSSFKLVLSPSTDTDPPTNAIWTADNITAVPSSSANMDVQGVAGETLTAGQVVYLSDGSGGKTAGSWYIADADLTYASTLPLIGMVPSTILIGATGTIRLGGYMTGLTSLTAGTTYYVSSTAGGLSTSGTRLIGTADTATSLVMAPNPVSRASVPVGTCEGRLTATTAVPVTSADVSAATSIFFTPYKGNRIALYDGVNWNVRTFAEITISLAGLTASKPYDIFAYDNAGVVTIETLVWTNTTTRATALTLQDGVLSKTGVLTRRYLGTVYINASGGQTDDTYAKRYIFNYTHRVRRAVRRLETTASWTYTTATLRQANAAAANQIDIMNGWAEEGIAVAVSAYTSNATGDVQRLVSIGENSTSVGATGVLYHYIRPMASAGFTQQHYASLETIPAVGFTSYVWLEFSEAVGTTTWSGVSATTHQSGISGMWAC